MSEPLPQGFYDRDAIEVARDLVGQHVCHGDVAIRITEVEAYLGPHDSASHSRVGQTDRTAPLYGPPGHAYVYLVYGLHHLLNLVAGPPGAAVLIRAGEPVAGIATIRSRRGDREGPTLLDGPGKLGQALAVDTTYTRQAVFEPGGLAVWPGEPPDHLLVGPRVGIDYATPADRDAPWRFAMPDSRWVGHRKTLRPEADRG